MDDRATDNLPCPAVFLWDRYRTPHLRSSDRRPHLGTPVRLSHDGNHSRALYPRSRASAPRPLRLRKEPKVVFEDETLLVVEKPAGLLTMATAKERLNTLYRIMRAYANTKKPAERIFIIHRLDR